MSNEDTLKVMTETITKEKGFNTTKGLLGEAYRMVDDEISHPQIMLIQKEAQKDIEKISDALELLLWYEKRGVKFEFYNYQT